MDITAVKKIAKIESVGRCVMDITDTYARTKKIAFIYKIVGLVGCARVASLLTSLSTEDVGNVRPYSCNG
jgi:hypothetical protein